MVGGFGGAGCVGVVVRAEHDAHRAAGEAHGAEAHVDAVAHHVGRRAGGAGVTTGTALLVDPRSLSPNGSLHRGVVRVAHAASSATAERGEMVGSARARAPCRRVLVLVDGGRAVDARPTPRCRPCDRAREIARSWCDLSRASRSAPWRVPPCGRTAISGTSLHLHRAAPRRVPGGRRHPDRRSRHGHASLDPPGRAHEAGDSSSWWRPTRRSRRPSTAGRRPLVVRRPGRPLTVLRPTLADGTTRTVQLTVRDTARAVAVTSRVVTASPIPVERSSARSRRSTAGSLTCTHSRPDRDRARPPSANAPTCDGPLGGRRARREGRVRHRRPTHRYGSAHPSRVPPARRRRRRRPRSAPRARSCSARPSPPSSRCFSPGATTNPHRVTHTPGGSSSGSAAAVATGMVDVALGTQTAGSVVRPASFCGVFGFKPTFGTVATAGVKPVAPSLDTVGWFARDVALARPRPRRAHGRARRRTARHATATRDRAHRPWGSTPTPTPATQCSSAARAAAAAGARRARRGPRLRRRRRSSTTTSS